MQDIQDSEWTVSAFTVARVRHSSASTYSQTVAIEESMCKHRFLLHSGETQRVSPTIPLHAHLNPEA